MDTNLDIAWMDTINLNNAPASHNNFWSNQGFKN